MDENNKDNIIYNKLHNIKNKFYSEKYNYPMCVEIDNSINDLTFNELLNKIEHVSDDINVNINSLLDYIIITTKNYINNKLNNKQYNDLLSDILIDSKIYVVISWCFLNKIKNKTKEI